MYIRTCCRNSLAETRSELPYTILFAGCDRYRVHVCIVIAGEREHSVCVTHVGKTIHICAGREDDTKRGTKGEKE